MNVLYRPSDGVAADFIPFYWKGHYHLFYLKDYRDWDGKRGYGMGTPWFHLVTRDFVKFDDWGEALARGTKDEQDLYVFTGSVIERDGLFNIFYTGHNSLLKEKQNLPMQGVMRATSSDLRTWTKKRDFLFLAPSDGYEPHDWRAPFVLWNEDAGEYWMLLAARKTTGPSRNRGCVALAASPDLETWEVREPFWMPDEYFTHECPDLFRIGRWWYLVYSTFTERCVTHYRMSRSLNGPWLAPANDTFDARAFYAAKTAGDGKRRYIFGWLPTRNGEKDDGGWEWGGELVTHEVVQQKNGTLAVRAPRTVAAHFNRAAMLSPTPVLGNWKTSARSLSAASTGRHSILSLGLLPADGLIEAKVTFSTGTASCGLLLRCDETCDKYYQVRLEPGNRRIVFDRWPRPGDQPFVLERPLAMKAGTPVTLRVLVDGSCVVVYANDALALSCRMYEHREGGLGLFVTEGEAAFTGLTLRTR